MTTNRAAWLLEPKQHPLVVKDAPYPRISDPSDIVVKVAAIAINPLEYKIQDFNPPIGGRELQYPTIIGADLAGTVIEAGPEAAHRVGDRIVAISNGAPAGDPTQSAFQQYAKVKVGWISAVPPGMPLEKAVVLPLASYTAMAALFVTEQLGLSTARLQDPSAPRPGSAILIWGGSSSVGCCAIQQANAAGYEVYTTASKRNHDLVTSIGAMRVFDHTDANVEAEIVQALRGKTVAGAFDCISDPEKTIPVCSRILAECSGLRKVVCVLDPPSANIASGVEVQRLSIPALRGSEGFRIAHPWIQRALADGTLQPKPDPDIVGNRLEDIQAGIDKVRKGVSGSKVVIQLQD